MVNSMIRKKQLKKGEIIPLSFDYMFTEAFNDEKNIMILENFLAVYLNVDIYIIRGRVKLLSRNIKIEHKKESNAQVDLLVDLYGNKYK